MRRWFSIPPKRWFDLLLATGLVVAVSFMVRGPKAPHPFGGILRNDSPPPPGAQPLGQGGVAVLTPGRDRPVRLSLDGRPWELQEVRYSRHDDQTRPMLDHAWKLAGRYDGFETPADLSFGSVTPPDSAPHVRVSIRMRPLQPVDTVQYQPNRFLLRDHLGHWHPPVYYGEGLYGADLGFLLPPELRPTALGWRAGVNLYYRGIAYNSGFVSGRGTIYVLTDPAGNDTGFYTSFLGSPPELEASDDGRFFLDGVDVRRWTEQHAKDRGFGETKELIRFDRSDTGGERK